MVVELAAQVLAPACLVYAQVVDIEGFDGGEDVVVFVLLEDAEGVAQYLAGFVYGGKNGAVFVLQQVGEFLVGVFADAGFKEVRAALVVDFQDLGEQAVKAWMSLGRALRISMVWPPSLSVWIPARTRGRRRSGRGWSR